MVIKEDSLKKRYSYKLFTNYLGFALSFITLGIVPRGLGPQAYGNFNFLSSFFTQIMGFLELGSAPAFYTKISQRQKEFGLVSFYFYFIGLAFLILIIFVVFMHLSSFYTNLLPGQELSYIYLAAGWVILSWIVQLLNQMADAYGLTVFSELANLSQKILIVLIVFSLYVFGQLNIANFFYGHYVALFFLAAIFVCIMEQKGYSLRQNWRLSPQNIQKYIKEFYNYSHPLFIFSFIGLVTGVLDRWILQFYGGSVQQGFYGLSYRIGTLCFFFTSAMTPLLMREFSIAFSNKDLLQLAALFRRYVPVLYSVTAYFSCFIVLEAEKIIQIFGGKSYQGAIMATVIMAFYPLHQTYGQLSGSLFMATGQTKLYRNISVVFLLIGLPITYFLIAPHEKMGLNAGAIGLAAKMVLIQFMVVNTQLYFNTKFLKLSFWRYLSHQVLSVVCLLSLAALATYGVDEFGGLHKIPSFIIAGAGYTLMVMGIIYYFPVCFGLEKQDIQFFISKIKKYKSFYK